MARQMIVRGVITYLAVLVFAIVVDVGRTMGQSKPTPSFDFGKLADDYFAPLVAGKRANAAVVVFTNKERVIFSKTYGPVDFDRSIWRAASVSKALTAIAIVRLVEEGRVDLDSDVNRYLKTFKIPSSLLLSGNCLSTDRVWTTASLAMVFEMVINRPCGCSCNKSCPRASTLQAMSNSIRTTAMV
jgi:D-alanyl-D-alanine carboxypeptidase